MHLMLKMTTTAFPKTDYYAHVLIPENFYIFSWSFLSLLCLGFCCWILPTFLFILEWILGK